MSVTDVYSVFFRFTMAACIALYDKINSETGMTAFNTNFLHGVSTKQHDVSVCIIAIPLHSHLT